MNAVSGLPDRYKGSNNSKNVPNQTILRAVCDEVGLCGIMGGDEEARGGRPSITWRAAISNQGV